MNSEGGSIKVFTKVWGGSKLNILGDVFYICTYKYLKKRQKEKINLTNYQKQALE